MSEITEIENVPPDVDPTEVGTVTNPLSEEFVCIYNGRKRIKIQPKEAKTLPLNICIHVAKHLADRIVYGNREKEILKIATKEMENSDGKLVKILDEKLLFSERKLPIVNYREKLWTEMKKIVHTDSKFFSDPRAKSKATGHVEMTEGEIPEDEMEDM
jgi:hypothetical protein